MKQFIIVFLLAMLSCTKGKSGNFSGVSSTEFSERAKRVNSQRNPSQFLTANDCAFLYGEFDESLPLLDLPRLRSLVEIYRTTPMSPEFKYLAKSLVSNEFQSMNASLKLVVQGIRRKGQIPVYRAIVGEWKDPSTMLPNTPENRQRTIDELRAKGFESSLMNEMSKYVQKSSYSVGLTATGALEVAMTKEALGYLSGSIILAVAGWNGKDGVADWGDNVPGVTGADPLEIRLAANDFKVVQKFKVSDRLVRKFLPYKDKGRAEVWHFLSRELSDLTLQK